MQRGLQQMVIAIRYFFHSYLVTLSHGPCHASLPPGTPHTKSFHW